MYFAVIFWKLYLAALHYNENLNLAAIISPSPEGVEDAIQYYLLYFDFNLYTQLNNECLTFPGTDPGFLQRGWRSRGVVDL